MYRHHFYTSLQYSFTNTFIISFLFEYVNI
nr:MAG TPA: hypothetical protein [Caudoviricetes sp.]